MRMNGLVSMAGPGGRCVYSSLSLHRCWRRKAGWEIHHDIRCPIPEASPWPKAERLGRAARWRGNQLSLLSLPANAIHCPPTASVWDHLCRCHYVFCFFFCCGREIVSIGTLKTPPGKSDKRFTQLNLIPDIVTAKNPTEPVKIQSFKNFRWIQSI